jgi:hypothetical protein
MVFVRYAVVLCLLFSTVSSTLSPQAWNGNRHDLKLTAHRSGRAIAEANGAFLYTADLLNESGIPVNVEAVQMGGGYAGDGQFFACSLQTWDDRDQRWVMRRRAKLSNYGQEPHLITKVVKPGDHEEVCGMYLPAQAGSAGDCARFFFQTQWQNGTSQPVLSEPFVIGHRIPSTDGPCRVSSPAPDTLLHESGHTDPPKPQ